MRNYLRRVVREVLDELTPSYTKTNTSQILPPGYNPIQAIRGGLFHWVAVPFNGVEIWCELRCPNATQLEQCGNISNIIIDKEEAAQKEGTAIQYEYEEVIQIRNFQEKLCELVLNKPTFDNISTLVGENDFVLSEKRKELTDIKDIFEAKKSELSETEKDIIHKRLSTLELQLGFILPDDTMAFLTKWAMGNDVSDIKKITKDSFLRAASLAKAHNKAPSDYLSGVFTDYNKNEIDTYAFIVLDDFMKQQQIVNSGKHKWLFGNNKQLPPRGI